MTAKKNILIPSFLCFMCLCLIFCSPKKSVPQAADIIFKNGAVYTMDETHPWVEAVVVGGEKILYAGSDSEAEKFRKADTKIIDLNKRMVLPAFCDSHIHLVSGGIELSQCNLSELQTREEVFKKIESYVSQNHDKPWIVGGGWALPLFPDACPTREQLDRLIPDRPAFFSAADGHSAWVNSLALKIAGVTKDTPDPKEGRIERDKKTDEPSGTLRESAMELISLHLPELSTEDYIQGLKTAQAKANSFGITSILEANADEKILEAYAALDSSREMTVRVLASQFVDPKKGEAQIEDLLTKRRRYQGKLLRATTAKIFADGVIESKTATLLEPYLDRPGYRGIPNIEPEELDRLAAALDKEKFQIHIHAIGDWATRMSLDALERAQATNGRRDSRHHIAHLELINPDDIPRFSELGVLANFQPLWAYADTYITELTEPALGPERSRWLYPIGSMVKSGAKIVAGSDWSVSSMNPLDAIQVAVTRRGLDDTTGKSWIPEEIVTLPIILAAYTINGAYVCHQDELTGSIVPGKSADIIVLNKNLFEIPHAEIHKCKVLLTLLEGREVFRDDDF
ncbi:MAG: amidohydrolase [Candidatus Aminicenantes bacterium]|nr:amidohydrolase [Candidatus Aminicenantes bacterium]